MNTKRFDMKCFTQVKLVENDEKVKVSVLSFKHFASPEANSRTMLSSPRAKRAGPKGLRAESARAVTGRRCPHSGRGEVFLSRQPDFFYGNSCNSGTESRKIVSKVGN